MSGSLRAGMLVVGVLFCLWAKAARGDSSTNAFTKAQFAYLAAQSNYLAHSGESQAAIKFAVACFERADLAVTHSERIRIAQEGIAVTRSLVEREPTNAAAHYYLALNLGQVAQIKRMSALSLVSQMEKELLKARSLDEKLDYAGPDRCLGLIYQDAPGWPLSVGSRSKARDHFWRAVELCPNYPDNRLCLIEVSLRWNDRKVALQQEKILNADWLLAKSLYSGEQWKSIWNDWQERWNVIEVKLAKDSKDISLR